ncbi:transporter substrate-binding domain-containing protein [Labedaea rhizosphaerae]|uniref:ABC-type amino acid transport substrate-binding protein n=1 Tax=Labedaea rhizosphaerae TaxID=598644 RepID=A0A4R6SF33_LABRH|nr:transporter substrate-binding domain-containing protein [Labedaea rhizosphaerae]TDP97696.1 ABC-type amino acid transport substrate-binding protein [Labedaea rhizosphaerae]
MNDLSRRRLFRAAGGLAVLGLASACTSTVSGSPVPVPHPTPVQPPTPPNRLAKARQEGVAVLAVTDARPFSYQDSSGLTGEVVEVSKAAFTALGIRAVKFELTGYEAVQQKLATMAAAGDDSIACFGGALIFEPSMCQTTDPVPDFQYKIAFGVQKGNPKKITTMDDVIKGKRSCAVLTGTPLKEQLQAAGVTSLPSFASPMDAMKAVADGRADCFPFYDISLRLLASDNPVAGVEVVGSTEIPGVQPMVAGFQFIKNEDTSLRDAFAAQLETMRQDGQWLQIAGRFGLNQDNAVPQDYSNGQFCH